MGTFGLLGGCEFGKFAVELLIQKYCHGIFNILNCQKMPVSPRITIFTLGPLGQRLPHEIAAWDCHIRLSHKTATLDPVLGDIRVQQWPFFIFVSLGQPDMNFQILLVHYP